MLVEVHALASMLHLHHQTIRALIETGLIPGRPVHTNANEWDVPESAMKQLLAASESSPEKNWQLTYQVRESLQTALDTLYDLNRGILEQSFGRYPDEIILPIQAQVSAAIDRTTALITQWSELIAALYELDQRLGGNPPTS